MRGSQRKAHKTAPLGIDSLINELLKMFVGSIVFFMLYFLIFEGMMAGVFWTDLSVLTVINLIAMLVGYVVAYALLRVLLKKNYAVKSFTDYNRFTGEHLVKEIILLLLNAMTGAFLIIHYFVRLSEQMATNNVDFVILFLLIWIGYKVVLASVVFVLTRIVRTNVFSLLIVFALFGALLFTFFLLNFNFEIAIQEVIP